MREVVDPIVRNHLLGVAAALRAETPGDLDPERRRRRLGHLDRLEAYVRAGRFPRPKGAFAHPVRNSIPPRRFGEEHGRRMPLFLDDQGTWCAVGALLSHDLPDLARAVVRSANAKWLGDMEVPGLVEWAEQAGFTIEELAWLQPAYSDYIAVCEDIEPTAEEPTSDEAECEGPDAGVWRLETCAACGGRVEVWATLVNEGTEDVRDARLTLSVSPARDYLDLKVVVEELVAVRSGESVLVGPFPVGDIDRLGIVEMEVRAPGDCFRENDRDVLSFNGSHYFLVLPETCPACACNSITPAGSIAPMAMLLLSTRRRRRRLVGRSQFAATNSSRSSVPA